MKLKSTKNFFYYSNRKDLAVVLKSNFSISYSELFYQANQIAFSLYNKGIKKDNYIPLLIDDNLLFIKTVIALWNLGAVPVPLNTKLLDAEIFSLVDDYNFRFLKSLCAVLLGVFLLPQIAYFSDISTEKIIQLTNEQRIIAGTNTLTANQLLTSAAYKKAEAILKEQKFAHNFEGRRFLPGSTVVATFDNYSINDIQLSGTRTLTNITESSVSAPKFQIQLENGKAVWPDGSEATREHCLVRTWIRANNPLNDAMVIEQCDGADVAASGTNRRGKSYTMSILEPLVYKRGCPIAVEGVKQFVDVASGKVILVNYGEGDCDRSITISVDGNSRTVNVNKKG